MPNRKEASPKSDSDLIKLIRDFEAKRQERERLQKDLARIAEDLDKITKYFEGEVRKLTEQRESVDREMRVVDVQLGNIREVAGKAGWQPVNQTPKKTVLNSSRAGKSFEWNPWVDIFAKP